MSSDVVKTTVIFLHCIAMGASLIRLIYRTRTRRLWWDDFWAFISMLGDLALVTLFGTRHVYGYNPNMSEVRRVITVTTITSVLWGARLSVAVAIVRLVPPGRGRHGAKGAAVLFALMWCGLLIQKLFICQSQFGNPSLTQCYLPSETGIMELCTDLAADTWLICSPAYLLWNVKLTNRRQIVIFSVFASDILLAAASVVHGVFVIQQKRPAISLSGYIEVAISLIICNLLVLVTWVYSRMYPSDEEEHSTDSVNYPTTIPASRSRHPNAPRYGFDGSVLVLTQMSSPSISIASTFPDNLPTNPTFGRVLSKPRTHSLDTLYPIIALPGDTLPSYLRPTQSCPALFHSALMMTSEKIEYGYDKIKLNNVRFEPRTVKPSRSLALSSDSESWDPIDAQGCGTGGRPHRSRPPHRKSTQDH